jgi:hypothetical protein
MNAARVTSTDIQELVNHLKAITEELTALHGDLYWLAMQTQDVSTQESSVAALNVEQLAALKGAVDNMRLLLWNYIETASEINPQDVKEGLETQRVQRATQFLKSLRERLGTNHDQQPLSFIERISAAMKERLGNKVA